MDLHGETHLPLLTAPATVYRELLYHPGGAVSAWIRERFDVIGQPGATPKDPPRSGDVLLTVPLGRRGGGDYAILVEPGLSRRRHPCNGWFGTVTDGAGRHGRRQVLDTAHRLPPGRLLLRSRIGDDPLRPTAGGDIVAGETGVGAPDATIRRESMMNGTLIESAWREPSFEATGAGLANGGPVFTSSTTHRPFTVDGYATPPRREWPMAEAWHDQGGVADEEMPTRDSTFTQAALSALPDVLQATPVVQLTATVPTSQVVEFVITARQNLGADPGWGDRLLVDPKDLPKVVPTATVHVFVVKTVPFNTNDTRLLKAFHDFVGRVHPSKTTVLDVVSIGDYPLNRSVDERFRWPPATTATAAGLGTRLPVDEAAKYKIVIHTVFPSGLGRVIAPRDHRSLRNFVFDRFDLTADHERAIDSLAREVVHSWHSRSAVTRILIDGHTDPVGATDYNELLGIRRANAVGERLRQRVDELAVATRLPAGTVDRIAYVANSFGKTRPISRRMQSLNRRVDITLARDTRPAPAPLDLDVTVTRLEGLLTAPGLDPDAVRRMRCLLSKVRDPDADDRFVNDTQVFFIDRDNSMPAPTEWSRVRSLVLHPDLFAPTLSDQQVLHNLGRIDEDVIYGIEKMNQMIAYASGADYGLGLLALSNAFKELNEWIIARLGDAKSVYGCYPDWRP